MIKVDELELKLKIGKLDSLYLFYGEEIYLLENSIKKIKKIFGELVTGINYILLDDTNIQNLISEIEAPAFGYDKKLIIVKNANLFKKEAKRKSSKSTDLQNKVTEYIVNNIDIVKENCIIVFSEEEAEKCPLMDFIEKNGVVCNFNKLTPANLAKRMKAICDAYKVNIDSQTANYFIETVGTSMQDEINEIRKLIEYVGASGTIKKNNIDELCIKQTEAVIWNITDELGAKNISAAIKTYQELIYQKEPAQRILSLIYNQFKKLYLTKLAEKENKDISAVLDLKPNQLFLVSKYKKQASSFDENILKKLLKELTNLDTNYKQGQIDLEVGLQSILCASIDKK